MWDYHEDRSDPWTNHTPHAIRHPWVEALLWPLLISLRDQFLPYFRPVPLFLVKNNLFCLIAGFFFVVSYPSSSESISDIASKGIVITVTHLSIFYVASPRIHDSPKHIFLELNQEKNHRSNSQNSKPRKLINAGSMEQRLHYPSIGKESLNT